MIASEKILFRSPDPAGVYCYSPWICQTQTGRLVATFDLGGPGVRHLPGTKSSKGDDPAGNQGKVYVSDDGGHSWSHRADFPLLHARVITAGDRLYLIGHSGSLGVMCSDDEGETWSSVHVLDDTHCWHQAPCAMDYHGGRLFLTMEVHLPGATWPGVAPVLMSASLDDDLTDRRSWTFSKPLRFQEVASNLCGIGVPFYPTGHTSPNHGGDPRFSGDPCWLESNVVRVYDPRHHFFDPDDRTVYLWMRMHSGLTNLAAIAKGTIERDGSLSLSVVTTPAGSPLVVVPCPGGQMKFHITYDQPTGCYWLLSTRATDSMTRPELLPAARYNLPDNERNRLQLHYSTNLFDWQFAGMVASGPTAVHSRHYASMIAVEDDLLILSRSGDHHAKSAHNGNLITLHRVTNFRELVDPSIVDHARFVDPAKLRLLDLPA